MILMGFFIVSVFVGGYLMQTYPNSISPNIVPLSMVAGWATGGAICWKLGRAWNSDDTQTEKHTLYFVPVEYCGALSIGLAIATGGLMLFAWVRDLVR